MPVSCSIRIPDSADQLLTQKPQKDRYHAGQVLDKENGVKDR